MLSENSSSLRKTPTMTSPIRSGLTSQTFLKDVNSTAKNKERFLRKQPVKSLKCYKCGKLFPSFAEVVMHLKFIHNACATPDCSRITNFKMHSPSCLNRGFGCSICNKRFSEKNLLLAHFNNHIGVAFYACDVCRDGFQQRNDLQTHLLLAHGKNVLIPFSPAHAKVVYQKCDHCSKYFKLFAEFQEHVSLCNISSSYACITCHVAFASSIDLDFHSCTEHKPKDALKGSMALKVGKRYFCGLCNLGFTKGDILRRHLIAAHINEVNFICDVCQVNFNNEDDLQAHYLQHIEEHYVLHDVISQYSCNSCKKTFKTQNELKEHLVNCGDNNLCVNVLSKTVGADSEGLSTSESDKENGGINSNASEKILNFSVDFSEYPFIYALKSGEDLINCDDSECIVVVDKKALFVVQRGVCASESRMPDVKNSEACNEDDVIDASLLQDYLSNILRPVDENIPSNSGNLYYLLNNIEASGQNQNSTSDLRDLEAINFDPNDTSLKYVVEGNFDSLPAEYRDAFLNSVSTNEGGEFVIYTNAELHNSNEELAADNQESKVPSATESTECNKTVEEIECGNPRDEITECKKDPEEVTECNKVDEIIESNKTHGEVIECNKSVDEVMDCNDELSISDLYICSVCKQVFGSKTTLCYHMTSNHTGYDCYECGASFETDEDMKKHEKNEHQNAYHCSLCDVVYPKEHLLERHTFSAHGGKKFVCIFCKNSYVKKSEYDLHMMLHKGKTPPTKCEICGKIYASMNNFIRHKAMHEEKKNPRKKICL